MENWIIFSVRWKVFSIKWKFWNECSCSHTHTQKCFTEMNCLEFYNNAWQFIYNHKKILINVCYLFDSKHKQHNIKMMYHFTYKRKMIFLFTFFFSTRKKSMHFNYYKHKYKILKAINVISFILKFPVQLKIDIKQ